jgi:MFS family permease
VAHARTADLFSPQRRALTIGLVSTVTLVAFEALAISTVMPIVAREIGGIELYGWVFSAFFLGNLVGIVVLGGRVDRGSLGPPFAMGLGLFAVGLLVGGLTPTMPILVAARLLQGFGGGAIAPIAYVAIGRSLPHQLQPRMFALLSTAWVVPGLAGPAIAGWVGDYIHWRWVFLGLLPLLVAAGAVAMSALRAVPSAEDAVNAASNRGRETEHDAAAAIGRRVPASLALAVGAGIFLAGLTATDPNLAIAGALIGLPLLVLAFRRLTPAGTLVLRNGLPAAIGLRGLLTFAFFAVDAYVPLALQESRGTTAAEAGIALTSATLSWTAGSWVQARMSDRLGIRRLVGGGFGALVIGLGGFALVLNPQTPIVAAVAAFAVAGLGMGLAYGSLSLAVLRVATPGAEGLATSGLQLSDVLGSAVGTGIGGAFVAFGERNLDLSLGLGMAFAMAVGVAGLGLLTCRRLPGLVAESAGRARPAA